MQTVSFAGSSYNIPNTRGDRPWSGLSDFVIAAASKAINTAGGNFTLLADINFGATFGLVSTYYKSRTANVASAGQIRLANADTIKFRNTLNNGDLSVAISSNRLTFEGSRLLIAGAAEIVNADVSASAAIAYSKLNLASSIVNADVSASAAIAYSKLALTGSVVNADIANAAAIAVSKLAALTASRVAKTDGSGFLTTGTVDLANTNEITGTLAATNGGTGTATVTQGDLLYGASNAWSKLAKNTSSTRYLSNTGASNDPAWAQVALTTGVSGTLPIANGGTNSAAALNNSRVMISSSGAIVEGAATTVNAAGYVIGSVIQTVTGSSTTSKSTSSGTYQTTNLTATITPKATTHKILVIAVGEMLTPSISACDHAASIFRDSTDTSSAGPLNYIGDGGVAAAIGAPGCVAVLDSPASTSAIVYSVKIKVGAGSGTIVWGTHGNQFIILQEIAA